MARAALGEEVGDGAGLFGDGFWPGLFGGGGGGGFRGVVGGFGLVGDGEVGLGRGAGRGVAGVLVVGA